MKFQKKYETMLSEWVDFNSISHREQVNMARHGSSTDRGEKTWRKSRHWKKVYQKIHDHSINRGSVECIIIRNMLTDGYGDICPN